LHSILGVKEHAMRVHPVVAVLSLSLALSVGMSLCAELVPVPVQAGVVNLTPQNTKIQFVCAHVGAKPDPRTGGFAKFSGQAQVDPATKALKSLKVEIDTASLFTQIDKLTNHLKSPDFFEVRKYPTATFESTKIEGGPAASKVTGKLTLHGETKDVSFPATVTVTDVGLTLHSSFSINRLDFGINYDPKRVENKVDLTVSIGEKS
jgi:polyisoprenoid-binding protein YceI